MRRLALTAVISVAVTLGAFACSAFEIEVTREVPVEVTRKVNVPFNVTREVEVTREVSVEVTREVIIEVTREIEVTRVIPVKVEVTPTPTPIPPATPTPATKPTPTVDVWDVDYVDDIEVPADFVEEATNIAVAYCEGRTYSADRLVLDHFGVTWAGLSVSFYGIGVDGGSDDCRADALAAMAIRSKRMSEASSRIFQADKFLECYNTASLSPLRSHDDCGFEELYPARHLPEYDRESLIVIFEDNPPAYPLEYLLTEDELWARKQIWRSLIRFFHFRCMDNAESTEGRRFLNFDSDSYVGYIPNSIEDNWWSWKLQVQHEAHWGTDGPGVGLCSAYDIKVRAEHVMWGEYDNAGSYFGYLATGFLPGNPMVVIGSLNFTKDLAAMRSNPPEMPNRFAASSAGE